MKASSPPAQKIAEPSTWQRLIARTRRAIAPPVVHDLHLSSAATVNAHFWLGQFPWRITAGWSMIAALLAAGALWRPWDLAWRDVVLLWLLADPIWGSLWRLAAGRMELPAQRGRSWATISGCPICVRDRPQRNCWAGTDRPRCPCSSGSPCRERWSRWWWRQPWGEPPSG
jgi:hypothetical protein